MSKIKLTGDTSGYVEISAPNVAANNTLELGGGTKILTNLDNVFTGVTTYSGNIDLNANLDLGDDNIVRLGTGNDLQIYHNGSNSYIDDSGTGALFVRGNYLAFAGINGEQLINAEQNAAVELFHDGTKKLETTATGATVTGTLVSGSVTSELDLTAISSSISGTAVDVFVYDTRKDSDGGAWRKRTQHTSWYNETLNTSTRGSRKEFPAVAVIVAETDKVTIYDGDDPDLPMWMVFEGTDSGWKFIQYGSSDCTSLFALNGILCVGSSDGGTTYGNLAILNFIKETARQHNNPGVYQYTSPFVSRNVLQSGWSTVTGATKIVNTFVNDVAMTVLPNAPIDDATELPTPTIAVATDRGVSVIRDDGIVADLEHDSGTHETCRNIAFSEDKTKVLFESDYNDDPGLKRRVIVEDIPSADTTYTVIQNDSYQTTTGGYDNGRPRILGGSATSTGINEVLPQAITSGEGITFLDNELDDILNSKVAYATTSYNTGWMQGDIKGAFLSDTTVESLTANTNLASNFVQGSTNRLTSETYDNGDTSWQMVDNAGSANGYVVIELRGLTIGQSYIISMTWDNNAALDSGYNHRIAHKNGTADENDSNFTYWNKTNGSSEILTGVFTAQSVNDDDLVIYANAITLNITNFNVRAVDDEDRSVNNKGLEVHGTITKQPVATGAELVSYSGWSSSNYLIQPYNSDLNFGTGNWCYMFWYNPNDAESGDVIFSRWSYNVDSNQGPRLTAYFNSGNLRFDTADASAGNGYQGHFGSDGTQDSNEWHCAVILRRGPNLEIWIDGKNYKTATLNSTSDGSYTDTNAILEIGHSPNSGAPEAGLELALFRVSGTAPSPEQIKKMYEDEKHLFQENAKATLYGSSDAVTALAYDEDTELLHVGTSSGRSDFQGLRRINNTTTAVTTAISASDDLIAEQ